MEEDILFCPGSNENRPACHQHNDEFGSYLLQNESLKYIKKTTRGPSMDPCGTPWVNNRGCEYFKLYDALHNCCECSSCAVTFSKPRLST